MKRGADSSALMAGFTIVETMIVLAVTGLLFVAIATTWFGRQHKTEFQTSAQEVRSRIQQVVSDVQNGYFPNQNNFSCSVAGNALTLDKNTTNEQGTNYPCIFLGKVIQFHFTNTDPELFRIYTVAADGSQTDFTAAKPTVVGPSTKTGADFPDNSESGALSSGLTLQAYKVGNTVHQISSTDDVAIGFFSTLGQVVNGAYANGTQSVNLYTLSETGWAVASPPSDSKTGPNLINAALADTSRYTVNTSTELCFQSGGTNQFAVVTIGGDSSTLTADLSIKNGKCTNPLEFK